MPAPHEHLPRPRRELLDQVVRRGERLRRQRRTFLAMAAASVVLVAVALPLALTAGSDEQGVVAGAPVTTTTRPKPRVRVYHRPTTTHPAAETAKPGERRKPAPKPEVKSNNATRAPAAPTTGKPGAAAPKPTAAPPAPPSPIEESAACSGTKPLDTPKRGRIAYVRDNRIYTHDKPDAPLGPDGEQHQDPSWNPTGDQIVFSRGGVISVMDATTGEIRFALTKPDGAFDSDPAWSPDGKKVAFVRSAGGGTDVWVVNAQPGSIPRAVTKLAGDEWSPAWSADSCRITFAASDGNIHEILDTGKEEKKLFNGTAPAYSLSSTVAYDLGGDIRVYLEPNYPIRARGTNPSWSAGSDAIAFESDGAVYKVANADGAAPEFVATGTDPAW